MIDITVLVDKLNEDLNEILPIEGVGFDIVANTGATGELIESELKKRIRPKFNTTIKGVMTTSPSAVTPLAGLDNYTIACNVSVAVPVRDDLPNTIYKTFVKYIDSNNGVSFKADFTDISTEEVASYGVIPMYEMPFVGEQQSIPKLGFAQTISFYIQYQIIKDAVLSADGVIKVDDEQMVDLSSVFNGAYQLETSKYENDTQMRSTAASKGTGISISIPYKNTTVVKKIVKDIIENTMNTYTIKYYDGITYTEAKPYSDIFVISTGRLERQAGKIAGINVEFTLAADTD